MYRDELELEVLGPDGSTIHFLRPRPPLPSPPQLALAVLLFLCTLLTTTAMGGLLFGELPHPLTWRWWELWRYPAAIVQLLTTPSFLEPGLAFSLPLLAILLAHELGHYWACRRHRLNASLPTFIPVPFGIGTLGAFIRIRSPFLSKGELLDVGAAGPLAGFLVALPVLWVGLSHSQVTQLPPPGDHIVFFFGEPLLFQLVGALVYPDLPPGHDLLLHPTGYAAWIGLLVTALNLLPFGQLDGGHVAYAALGRLHRRLAWPLLLVLVILGLRWTGWWVWAVVALVMGVRHPPIPGEQEPLDPRRKAVAFASLVVFILCFTPQPVRLSP